MTRPPKKYDKKLNNKKTLDDRPQNAHQSVRTADTKNAEQKHKNPVVKKLNLALLKKDSDDNIPIKLNNLSKMNTDKSCQDLKMHLLLGKLH